MINVFERLGKFIVLNKPNPKGLAVVPDLVLIKANQAKWVSRINSNRQSIVTIVLRYPLHFVDNVILSITGENG